MCSRRRVGIAQRVAFPISRLPKSAHATNMRAYHTTQLETQTKETRVSNNISRHSALDYSPPKIRAHNAAPARLPTFGHGMPYGGACRGSARRQRTAVLSFDLRVEGSSHAPARATPFPFIVRPAGDRAARLLVTPREVTKKVRPTSLL